MGNRTARTAGALLAAAVVAGCGGSSGGKSSAGNASPASPAASSTSSPAAAGGRTTPPPWDVPADEVTYITAAGLPPMNAEAVDVHYHAHLDILDDGQAVPVAAGIGIDEARQRISPLHVHDETGVVHIESPKQDKFTLGQLFTEWNVRLTRDCVGGLCAGAGKRLAVYVDGKPYTGDPRAIVFAAHQEIALVYGTPPAKVPSSYNFDGL